jgi:hypothetical protein
MSSLAPKYGEPAPAAPAIPKARSGRSICTAETGVPPASPPTIQAVDPVTATAAWDTGTWSRPAASSRLVAGLKAQIVGTVEPAAPAGPDSWVVPRPGVGRPRQVPGQQAGLGGVKDRRRVRGPDRRRRAPVRAGAAVRQDREPCDRGDHDHGHRRDDGTPAADALRRPVPPGARLRPSPCARRF